MKIAGNIIEFYNCPTATVSDVCFKCQLNDQELRSVSEFVEREGYEFNNHIAFKMKESSNNSQPMYVSISDRTLCIGKSIMIS